LLDTPLFLARDMAPLERNVRHKHEYEKTRKVIETFGKTIALKFSLGIKMV
jgi:hypothetical protein